MTEYLSLYYKLKIYNIKKEPFELLEDTYKRAWFIVKNYDKYEYNELYSLSIINNNSSMQYV
jgi:hypothetical protein